MLFNQTFMMKAIYSLVEVVATSNLHDKNLQDLDVRAKYGCNIIGIQRGNNTIISPSAQETILEGDKLMIIGHNQDLTRFEEEGA